MAMSSRSAAAVRTAVVGFVLSVGALCALGAMEAKAEATIPESDPRAACEEGRALLAAKLAYLEARIAPKADQEGAWRTFADAVRASASDLATACAEEVSAPRPADAGVRLDQMEKRAAAMEAMSAAMAKAYRAVTPVLTEAQRDILSRTIVPPFPPPGNFSRPPRVGAMALGCAEGQPNWPGAPIPWGPPSL
jgi:LTXXQ motif family protein